MKNVLVKLSSVEMVKDFNSKLFPLEGEFDLGTGRYIVDARSIMGIFSLDLSKPLTLTIHSSDRCRCSCFKRFYRLKVAYENF